MVDDGRAIAYSSYGSGLFAVRRRSGRRRRRPVPRVTSGLVVARWTGVTFDCNYDGDH
jgi:hypothetical protein